MTATLATERLHVLYRFFNANGVLLYVGRTVGFGRRITSHRSEKAWWREVVRIELEHHTNLRSITAAERAAIQTEAPLYNVVHSPDMAAMRTVNGRIYSERHARRLRRGR